MTFHKIDGSFRDIAKFETHQVTDCKKALFDNKFDIDIFDEVRTVRNDFILNMTPENRGQNISGLVKSQIVQLNAQQNCWIKRTAPE